MSDLRTERDPTEVLVAPALATPGVAAEPQALERKRLGAGAWVAIGWLVLLIGLAVLAPVLPLTKLGTSNASIANLGLFRDAGHILGADDLGRDMLARVIWGARTSLTISFCAVAIGFLVGGITGLLSGYYRGTADTILTGLADVILAFPALILALALVTFLKGGQSGANAGSSHQTLPTQVVVIIALGVVSIPILHRITRASSLTWSQREFVLAAKAQGAKTPRILFKEVLPNVLPAMASIALLGVAVAIVAEGGLSIIGAGIDPSPNLTSWGAMIQESYGKLQQYPLPVFIPCAAMFLTVFALNYLGDAVRERFDVRESML